MTFLDALAKEKDIDWQRIVCFDMDEFYDPQMPEIFTCGYQISKQLFEKELNYNKQSSTFFSFFCFYNYFCGYSN